jgi:hypothetical protein
VCSVITHAELMMAIKNHDNLVMFCGVSEIDGKLGIVTKFCTGGSLVNALCKIAFFCLRMLPLISSSVKMVINH